MLSHKKNIFLGLMLIFVVQVSAQGEEKNCTVEEVRYCEHVFLEADHDVNQAVMPFLNESDAREHCSHFDQFSECLDPFSDKCTVSERLTYEGQVDAYRWWCYDLFDVYLAHQQCFSDKVLHNDTENCVNTLVIAVDLALDYADAGHGQDAWIIYCRACETYLICVERKINEHCDDPLSGKWQRGLDERLIGPRMIYMGCVVDGEWLLTGNPHPERTIADFRNLTTTTATPTTVLDLTQCNRQTIRHCTSILDDKGHEVNYAIVPSLTKKEAKAHCALYDKYLDCERQSRNQCEQYMLLEREGLEAAYNWWCNEAFQYYLEHRRCYETPGMQSAGDDCYKSMKTKVLANLVLYEEHPERGLDGAALCSDLRTYLVCVENIFANNTCRGDAPAKWQRGFDERAILPQTRSYRCIQDGKWYIDDTPYPSVTVSDLIPADEKTTTPDGEQTTKPGDEETTKPGDEKTTKPGDEKTTKPGDEKTTNPGNEKTTKPGDEKTTKPGNKKTTKPGDEKTTKPGDEKPTKPGDEKTTKPGDEKTTKPGNEKTTKPGEEETTKPGVSGEYEPAKDSDSGHSGSDIGLIVAVVLLTVVVVILIIIMVIVYFRRKRKSLYGHTVGIQRPFSSASYEGASSSVRIGYDQQHDEKVLPSAPVNNNTLSMSAIHAGDADVTPAGDLSQKEGFENPLYVKLSKEAP